MATERPNPIAFPALERMGIIINPRTIARHETGELSLKKIQDKEKAAEVLESGACAGKDNFFLDVAYKGLDLRELTYGRHNTQYSRAYRYDGFTEAIAEDLKVSHDTLRKLLKAVGAEIVSEELDLKPEVLAVFKASAQAYLEDFLDERHMGKAEGAQRAEIGWIGSIRSFYTSLFNEPDAKNAAWFPYVIDFLQAYFEDRIQNKSPLTNFDRLILQDGIFNVGKSKTIEKITTRTGLPIGSEGVISTYRHLLVFGSPINLVR